MSEAVAADEVETFCKESVRELVAEPDLVAREATIEELDLDSLDIVELGQMVQERYGVALDRKDFEDVRTLGDVVDVVVAQVRA